MRRCVKGCKRGGIRLKRPPGWRGSGRKEWKEKRRCRKGSRKRGEEEVEEEDKEEAVEEELGE